MMKILISGAEYEAPITVKALRATCSKLGVGMPGTPGGLDFARPEHALTFASEVLRESSWAPPKKTTREDSIAASLTPRGLLDLCGACSTAYMEEMLAPTGESEEGDATPKAGTETTSSSSS